MVDLPDDPGAPIPRRVNGHGAQRATIRPTTPLLDSVGAKPPPLSLLRGRATGDRPARCRTPGCELEGTHYPAMDLWAMGKGPGDHNPLRLAFPLPLCRRHARRRAWLTPQLLELVVRKMAQDGKMPPNLDTMRLGYVSIREGVHPYSRNPRD